MSLRSKIYRAFGAVPKQDVQRYVKKALQRGFDAAKYNRFRDGWKTSRAEINQELKSDWPALNARIWEARFNNAIVAGDVIDNRVNMIGPFGFDYQPMIKLPNGDMDEKANEFLVEKFDEWCDEDYCTITKRISFRQLQWIIGDHLRLDGAYILRKHIVGETIINNPFGFSLELLDVADIDYRYTADLKDGTTVIMGIRLDKWRRIISVFFKEKSLIQEANGGGQYYNRKEIFADDLIYGFDPMHYKMVVGVTPWAPALIKLKDLDIYTNYHMQNAKWAAGKMGFIKTTNKDAYEYNGPQQTEISDTDGDGVSDEVTTTEDSDHGYYMDIEGGVIEELPWGKDIELFDPKFPSEQLPDFIRATGREIATSQGKDYAAMWGDREGESYSSGRAGEMKTNNTTAYQQTLFTDLFLTRVTKNWLRYALLNGALKPYEYLDYKRLSKHYWQGFFRGWIDPLKQAMTDRIKMEDGAQSLNQTITKSGGRMKDVFEDEKAHKILVEKYGFDIVKTLPAKTKIDDSDNDDNDKDDKSKKEKDEDERSLGLTVMYKM